MTSKSLLFTVAFFVFCSDINGQALPTTKVSWERYAFQEKTFSLSLPKIPIRVGESDYEHSEETMKYGAYSNGVAYVVSYSEEAKDNPLKKYQPVEPFSEQNFRTRLEKIRAEFETRKEKPAETESTFGGWQVIELTGEKTIYKFYFNSKKNNWIELLAVRPKDSETESRTFLDSLKIEKKSPGKEVDQGANAVVGDTPPLSPATGSGRGSASGEVSKSNDSFGGASKPSDNIPKPEITKLRIVLKARANYTEEARKSQISGTVRVRVTFSSSGSTTSVTPISGLPYGLTEEAVAASRKILFVPEKRGGIRVSVIKTIEYNFNLY